MLVPVNRFLVQGLAAQLSLPLRSAYWRLCADNQSVQYSTLDEAFQKGESEKSLRESGGLLATKVVELTASPRAGRVASGGACASRVALRLPAPTVAMYAPPLK